MTTTRTIEPRRGAGVPFDAVDLPRDHSPAAPTAAGGALLPLLYSVTLLVSSMLLFLVQPMVGKMILPLLGGTPAVWNTCMVFFQAALLAGYGYAHGSARFLSPGRQIALHLPLLALPLLVLPISLAAGAAPPGQDNPVLWLLGTLTVGAGLPFFVVASSAPLLQSWFGRTAHAAARDPYFLYAASNVGSLAGLLGYPLLIEPALTLAQQARLWTVIYFVLIGLIALCAAFGWRSRQTADARSRENATEADNSPPLTTRQRARWVLLACVPSSLMLGVTAHITTNLAAIPLIWVVPLALYLITFIVAFARRSANFTTGLARALPLTVLLASFWAFVDTSHGWMNILAHLGLFFMLAMVCHAQLAAARPGVRHLTEYYLWISTGGMLGGMFNAILAPLMFNSVLEYPLMIVAACMLMPVVRNRIVRPQDRRLDWIWPAGMAAVSLVFILMLRTGVLSGTRLTVYIIFAALAAVCFTFKNRPLRFGLGMGVILLTLTLAAAQQKGERLYVERNFFGVKEVSLDRDGRFRNLVHGNTNHGRQSTDPARAAEPVSYYHRTGPMAEVFTVCNSAQNSAGVGIIGLGTGSIAAFAQPGQQFTFYEIDPAIERIARDPRYFTFLSQSRGRCDVVLGDGRLTLARAPDGHFGIILLDAFSSDAIPTHLLSREAVRLYLSKLDETGVLLFHISNRYLNFKPMLARLAQEMNLTCLAREDTDISPQLAAEGKIGSRCVVMARRPEDLRGLDRRPGWAPMTIDPHCPVWTDQFCDVLSLFHFGRGTERKAN